MMLRRHLAAAILTAGLFSVAAAADTIAELVLIDGQALSGRWLPTAEPGRVALHADGQDRPPGRRPAFALSPPRL